MATLSRAGRRAPRARAHAPAVSAAKVVCLDGRLKPSGSMSQFAAGGRGRAITRESRRRIVIPVITVRHGMAAAGQPLRRTATRAETVSGTVAAAGSARALMACAARMAAGLRRRTTRLVIFSSRSRSWPPRFRVVATASPASAPTSIPARMRRTGSRRQRKSLVSGRARVAVGTADPLHAKDAGPIGQLAAWPAQKPSGRGEIHHRAGRYPPVPPYSNGCRRPGLRTYRGRVGHGGTLDVAAERAARRWNSPGRL